MANQYILMGDIIGSRGSDLKELQAGFGRLVSSCNRDCRNVILSPYTITLGDEFQGVAGSLRGVTGSIFYLEEERIRGQHPFRLRYVAVYGEIETPLNERIAYGMMGSGLSRARELLSAKRRGRPRFLFELPDPRLTENLNRLYRVIDGLSVRWNQQDYPLIVDMLESTNNEEVGARHGKNRSQVWKRRKHLLVEEYRAVKDTIFTLVNE